MSKEKTIAKKSVKTKEERKRRINAAVNQVLISLVVFLFVIPLLFMLVTALKPADQVMVKPFKLVADHLAWENIARAWTSINFPRFLLNSVLVGICCTMLTIMTSTMSAYAFARLKFKGRDILFLAYLGTLMIPQQVLILPLYLILKQIGWYNSYLALIVPPAFTAFGTFLMRQFFVTIPFEVEEAAKIDGCNPFRLYWNIMLPLAKPGIASLAIFCFVDNWKSFLWPLIVTSKENLKTIPLGLYMFKGQYGTDWSALMCATTIAIIPSFIIYLLFQNYLQEGIAMTGMGGK